MPSWLGDALEWAGIIVGAASAITGATNAPRPLREVVGTAGRVLTIARQIAGRLSVVRHGTLVLPVVQDGEGRIKPSRPGGNKSWTESASVPPDLPRSGG